MRPRAKKMLLFAPFGILGMLLLIALGGEIVRLLWNYALPPLFGWREITFWQALALLALSRILFGRIGSVGPRPWRSHFHRQIGERLADRIGDRWQAMTPEERERFRQRLRERLGVDLAAGESRGS